MSEGNSVCSHCKKYLKAIHNTLSTIRDETTETYVPYIYRVKDHWFRDVYFTHYAIEEEEKEKNREITIVENDDEYEEKTGERWTLYETDSEGEYKLYVYFKNGNEYDEALSDVLCEKVEKGEGKYKLSDDGITYVKATDNDGEYNLSDGGNVPEFRVGKKAVKNTKVKDDYMSYEIGNIDSTWRDLELKADSDESLQKLVATGLKIKYQMAIGTVKQVEDGVRGETKSDIKGIFLDEYYLYDGTRARAAVIQQAKQNSGSSDPDAYTNKKTKIETTLTDKITLKNEKGEDETTEYTNKYTATIDEISGPISLTHSALNAFSILENMHTLDSEFIYHDFKELIVELNYFDKEDLTEPEDEIMMFPVSEVSSAGWPVVRYDKSEQFYGTLIHSAEDLKALKAKTDEELQQIIDMENGAPEEDEDVNTPAEPVGAEQVTPANGAGDTSYANASELTDKQKMILQAAEDLHYYLETNGYDYSLTSSQLKNSLQESITSNSKYVCCATFIGWTAQALGMNFEMSHGSLTVNTNIMASVSGVQEIAVSGLEDFKSKLQPGDIVWRPRSGGQGHTQMFVGFDSNGNFTWYNCGSSDSVKKAQPYMSDYEVASYQKIFRWTDCELSYNGMSSSGSASSAEFSGFEGGETVVAPVSGEVIEYGITKRKNFETDAKEKEEVGYIKIRVLGKDEGKIKQGTGTISGITHKSVSATDINDVDDWLTTQYTEEELKTLGYDYFWEEYNYAGIRDYVLYLEGFDVSDVASVTGETISGKKNMKTLAKYIKQAGDQNSYSTQYSVPNLLDDTREFELKVKEAAKEKAEYTFKKDNKIYIKEGAAIGKTFSSDSEFMKEIKIKKTEGTDNEEEEEEENTGPYKVGNYLWMIFRDQKDEIIENVEEYVEVEKAGSENGNYGNQKYQFDSEELEMLAKIIHQECCATGQSRGLGEEKAELAAKATGYVIINRALINFGGHGTTIEEQLNAPGQYASETIQAILTGNPCDKCIAIAEWCSQNDCSSISNSSGVPMSTDVVYQSANQNNGSRMWESFSTSPNFTYIAYQ